uniref:Tumor necrosis factor receptor superfamily, member 11b n=1 Tax=Iconisemion striatum TaxID=60296 RepID=A0A1A7Z5G5_9TELE
MMSSEIVKSNPVMKLIVLFTASFSWAFQQQDAPPKYQYRDPRTADLLLCDQCPPGTSLKRHCTTDTPTECQPCPERHFAENWHWGDTCQYCTSVCKERQLVQQQCNSTHDQLCECAPGFYLVVEFCITHSSCPPGSGVKTFGTPLTDTVCERCPDGYFSADSSPTDPCQPHRNCSDSGLKTLRWGTSTSDSLCGPLDKKAMLECSQHHSLCRTDVSLCEEVVFQFLSSVPLERLLENLPDQKMDHKSLEKMKKTCSPQQQAQHLLRLWRQKNKDKVYGIIQGMNHCERKVSRCHTLKNLTIDDLMMVTNSLPGVRVQEQDVKAIVSTCLPRQYMLQVLHLWKTENHNLDLAKSLSHSLRVLRSQGAPRHLLKGLKKISRITGTTSAHKICEKMFVKMLQDDSCFKAHKALNE